MKRRTLNVSLVFALLVTLCGCGSNANTPATPDTNKVTEKGESIENAQHAESGEGTAKDLYMDFLAGTEKVYADKINVTYYDYEEDGFVPYFHAGESFTVTELMKAVIEIEQNDYELFLSGFEYCFVDCGLDGEEELAVHAIFNTEYAEGLEKQFVIKNIDGKLVLCHMMDSYYRSYSGLENISGLITGHGSSGAGSSYFEKGFVDANGDYHFVYDNEESFWAIYSLDERFNGVVNEEEIENTELYLSIYDFVEYNGDNWDEMIAQRMYCAEFDSEMYYDGNEEDNLAVLEPIFERANVKLYSREELNQAILDREKEAGLNDEMMNADDIEWIPYELNFNEINDIKEVSVSSVDELMNAIDSHTVIVLAPGEYNVTNWLHAQIRKSRVGSYFNYDVEEEAYAPAKYYGDAQIFYSGAENDPGLVLRGFNYCSIKSADALNPATIVSDPRSENVITFYDCTGMNFENIVFGHTDGNDECTGDVLYFGSCERVTMDNCDLYGCGATGIDLVECYSFDIDNTIIHDCSVGGINVSDSYGMNFTNSTLQDIDGYGMISMTYGGINFFHCTFRGTNSPILNGWLDGYMDFYNCTFDPILKDEIMSNEAYGEHVNIYEENN